METFVAIIEKGSLSAAARALSTVPSTASARLTALEGRLGVQLVTRTTRQLSLTDDGEIYLADCRRILAEIERSECAIRHRRGALSGHIRLTAPSDFGRQRVRPALDAFMQAHPRISVNLHLSDRVEDLGEHDLAIRVGPLKGSTLVARRLAGGHRVVCAAPSYWAGHPRPDAPADLAKHECLLWEGRSQAVWHFTSDAVQVRGRHSSNDGEVVRSWALAGLGVAQNSYWDVSDDLAAGRLEAVLATHARPSDLYVVYARSRHPTHRVRGLVNHLVEHFSKL